MPDNSVRNHPDTSKDGRQTADGPSKSESADKGLAPISSDRPKERLVDDRLGYANFARSVARSIVGLRSSEGIVMAVHGPWGSGKTSAVNMITDAVQELQAAADDAHKVIVVRFNPWWFSEQQDLTLSFFTELTAGLGHKVSSNVRDKLRALARRTSASKDLVLAALSFLPGGELIKQASSEIVGLLGEQLTAEHSLDQARSELQEALRSEGKRVLVIIDDVDRLPIDEARQIFRLVKSVADLPNVVYLLVFDRHIAGRALSGLAADGGPEWLEKIIQASFDLPPAHPRDLQLLFFEDLDAALGPTDIGDPTRWGNIFFDAIAPWLRTPRDVTRLINAISVSWPAVAGEVNVADFIAIETIRLFEPKLYGLIRISADRLTGASCPASALMGPNRLN